MTIPKIFIVALYGLLSFTAQAQNLSSISRYSGPTITFSPPKNVTPSSVISSACDFPVTLTQSTSQTIISGNSAACLVENLTSHHDNSYWRVFTLSRALNVTSVEIGIEQASATSGSQPLTVNIYENTGGVFPAGTRTLKGTANVDVSNQALTKLTIPISASLPSNAQMVLEVFTPSGVASESLFLMGANSSGQNGPSYISADSCGLNDPVTFTSVSFPNVHLVMNVIGCTGSYVDARAGGANNGTSWANAYKSLQDAMDAANTGDDMWVAAGTYLPTSSPDDISTDPRDKAFHLSKNIKIYGGFAGTETMLSERDWVANETILSGDFDANDEVSGIGASLLISNTTENAYHVFMVTTATSPILDGLTIKGGNANGSGTMYLNGNSFFRSLGGGICVRFGNIQLSNLKIMNNSAGSGGGLYLDANARTVMTNVNIEKNVNSGLTATSQITLSNSTISGNKGRGIDVGALNNSIIRNSVFSFNSNSGIYTNRNTTIVNCTFYENSAAYGGGISIEQSFGSIIKNCIFWNNYASNSNGAENSDVSSDNAPTVEYCLMQLGTNWGAGTGSITNQNPLFVNAEQGDFRLLSGSPALDAGDNNAWTATGLSTDIAGNTRPQNTTVDMGAYEGITIPAIIYVDSSATNGTKNGASWANAYIDLQDAIDNPYGSTEIWVAKGTYLPSKDHTGNASPTDPRDKNFHMAADMQLYGGFTGTETERSQRDWKVNPTILSGDFNTNDVVTGNGSTLSITENAENAYHVLITANLTSAAIIDGFYFKGGNANGSNHITFATRDIQRNSGGGIYNYYSNPTISNTTFQGNSASTGGGLVNEDSSPSIINTRFQRNSATYFGGGLYNFQSSSSISNAIFQGNSASQGGGLVNEYSSSSISNTTFQGNSATANGGGAYNNQSSPSIVNSIFWENSGNGSPNSFYNFSSSLSISHSLIPEADSTALSNNSNGGISSISNMVYNQNPQFVDATNGDLMLSGCSPAINTGDNAAWAATGLSTDLAGKPRPFGISVVDMGAYEYQGSNPFTNNIYVKHNATGDNDGSTWTNAYKDLQNGIDNQCGDLAIWVAAGTYLPKDAPDGTTSTGFTDRNNAFHLATDMKIYGGFRGTETFLSERDWKTNLTNLSGDFNGDDIVSGSGATLSITNNTENAYHIMITANLTSAAIIDGFNMRAGNATGGGNIVFSTRTFSNIFGGGVYNAFSSPNISNVTFQGNSANNGGGLYNSSSNPSIINTTFHGNLVSNSGGGLYNSLSSPIISNAIFEGNSAYYGAGLYNFTFSPSISNSTFKGNSAFAGGGMFNDNSDPSIINSIFWDNSGSGAGNSFYINNNSSLTISHSLIPEADSTALSNNSNGGISSISNMVYNQDPQFIDAAKGFLQLKCNSPAINAGTATGAPAEDITGFIRVGLPDIGAYEYGQAVVDIQIPDGTNPSLSDIPILKASSQILNTNNVLYQGSNNVQLLPGFSVAPTGGAATVFRAEIGGGCP